MLKIKGLILLFLSGILLLADLVITPYKITFAQKPVAALLGIFLVSYLDTQMAKAPDPVKLRKIFFNFIIILFVISAAFSVILKGPIPAFPFLVGCLIQSVIYKRGLKRALKADGSTKLDLYESPMPDVGFKIMSIILLIRDMLLNHKKLLEDAGIKEGDTLLDYGCGPGAFTIAAAKIVGNSGAVYALDNQHLAIQAVSEKAKALGMGHVKTIYTNQGETGLPDKSIDAVLLIGVLHAVRRPDRILTEIERVMKDDARLFMVSVHLLDKQLLQIVSPRFKLVETQNRMLIMKKVNSQKGAPS